MTQIKVPQIFLSELELEDGIRKIVSFDTMKIIPGSLRVEIERNCEKHPESECWFVPTEMLPYGYNYSNEHWVASGAVDQNNDGG